MNLDDGNDLDDDTGFNKDELGKSDKFIVDCYNKHQKDVFNFIRWKFQNIDWHTSEDLTQVTFERFTRYWRGPFRQPIKYPRKFLEKTAQNACLDYLGALKVEDALDEYMEAKNGEHFTHLIELEDLIEQLPKEQKEMLILHYLRGLSRKEIAKIYEKSPATVGGNIKVALAKVRRKLETE